MCSCAQGEKKKAGRCKKIISGYTPNTFLVATTDGYHRSVIIRDVNEVILNSTENVSCSVALFTS